MRDELQAAGATVADEDEIVTDGTLISAAGKVNIIQFLDVFLKAIAGSDEVERAA